MGSLSICIPAQAQIAGYMCPWDTLTAVAMAGSEEGGAYQWYRNDLLMAGAVYDTLLITDTGIYTCVMISNGCASGSSETITIHLKQLKAVDDTFLVHSPAPVLIAPLSNDKQGCTALDESSIVLLSLPLHGAVSLYSDGNADYTPQEGYAGGDTFSYQVMDMEGMISNIATVYITIEGNATMRLDFYAESSLPMTSSLYWDVYDEKGVDQYEILYALHDTAAGWITLTHVTATDLNLPYLRYHHIHTDPDYGDNFYKLKIWYDNGVFTYSNARVVHFDRKPFVMVSPNPVYNNIINIDIQHLSDMTFYMYDELGRLVNSQEVKNNTVTPIDVSGFPPALYFVILKEKSHQTKHVFKIVIMR